MWIFDIFRAMFNWICNRPMSLNIPLLEQNNGSPYRKNALIETKKYKSVTEQNVYNYIEGYEHNVCPVCKSIVNNYQAKDCCCYPGHKKKIRKNIFSSFYCPIEKSHWHYTCSISRCKTEWIFYIDEIEIKSKSIKK